MMRFDSHPLFVGCILLISFGCILSETEKDFEFEDNVVLLKKRSVVPSDDEDFLADDANVEGSATDSPALLTESFRVTINFTDLNYTSGLDDRGSQEFIALSKILGEAIQSLFLNVEGYQNVIIVSFSAGSLVVTFDLGSDGHYDQTQIFDVLNRAVTNGSIPPYRVSAEGFTFKPLQDGVVCPDFMGRSPDALPLIGDNRARLMINNEFFCRGFVTAWEYYRVVPRYTGYVGVFRYFGQENFKLVGYTELPQAEVGVHVIQANPPIPVEKGDFIGIFYSNRAEEGVVGYAQRGDIPLGELYQTYLTRVYKEELDSDAQFSLEKIPYEDIGAAFAIRAHMDYTGSVGSVTLPPPMTCAPDQFTCGSGECVQRIYLCDNTPDCSDMSDERNCGTEVVCGAGEFRCTSGTSCIAQSFVCNGSPDCPDNSDEINCPTRPCDANNFECAPGNCIPLLARCDGVPDCPDGRDEFACPTKIQCLSGEFTCRDGSCISMRYRCDGTTGSSPDCVDGSDEDDCVIEPVCPESQYRCANGDCIDATRCNGRTECTDLSDEWPSLCNVELTVNETNVRVEETQSVVLECSATGQIQPQLQWTKVGGSLPVDSIVQQGRLIIQSISLAGQGVYQCSVSDSYKDPNPPAIRVEVVVIEKPIITCGADEFTCRNGECVQGNYQCDGFVDCQDGSDENNCETPDRCPEGQLKCSNGECVLGALCNGRTECSDLSDEWPSLCSVELTVSTSRVTVEETERVVIDCSASGQIQPQLQWTKVGGTLPADAIVQQGRLIIQSISLAGQGVYQCSVSDSYRDPNPPAIRVEVIVTEKPYARLTIDPPQLILKENTRAIFNCIVDSNLDVEVAWSKGNNGLPSKAQIDRGRLVIPNLTLEDADTYTCRIVGFPGLNFPPASAELLVLPDCQPDQFKCADSTCIPLRFKCDGTYDCADQSDESPATCPDGVRCRDGEFQCDDKTCVRGEECNGIRECPDGSDEKIRFCGCQAGEFMCADFSACIPSSRECNRVTDCRDGSDEHSSCRCRENEFTCGDGTCIPQARKCDGRSDCRDASDENNCTLVCPPGDFLCADEAHCIESRLRCDGFSDCADNSDEAGCPCRTTEFTCQDGHCIDLLLKCDGVQHCEDGSDEFNCPCREDQFTCNDGTCIPLDFKCNTRRECEDGSDEIGCECPPGQFRCANGDCVPGNFECNGRAECEDASDEANCIFTCSPNEFTCRDGNCIPLDARCNRRYDCRDGSDELDCRIVQCRRDQFRCRSQDQCIDRRRYCDRRVDCRDRSDEATCPVEVPITVEANPRNLTMRVGRQAEFSCVSTGNPPPQLRWSRAGNIALPLRASEENGRLTIPDLQVEDSGDYQCRAIGVPGVYESTVRLVVVPIVGPAGCGPGEVTCRSGQCILAQYRCDGQVDCADGSDEFEDVCLRSQCEPNEFKCRNGVCIMKIWQCDGDRDCEDGSDEVDCGTPGPRDQCAPHEYQCQSRDMCIPAGFQCDKEIDCPDRSDEIGCSIPVITLPPVPRIDVTIGGSFTILCEAIGVPTPLIVWRLNWGNIPTGPRVIVTSVDGRGNLTITDARESDSGAYTCEAINVMGTIFASPDAIIIVKRTPAGICNPPYFNVDATITGQCLRCFCFGHTTECYSSDLHVSEINLIGRLVLTKQTQVGGTVDFVPQEVVSTNIYPAGIYYWKLPREFLGQHLSSYGGRIRYEVYYNRNDTLPPVNQADIILSGNSIDLYHRVQNFVVVGGRITVSAPLTPGAWMKTSGSSSSRRGDVPASSPATREDLMMVLENVDSILIKANYINEATVSRIGGIVLTTGIVRDTGLGRAVYVEECSCPAGYAGQSCQDCAPGYRRIRQGPYLGICRRCDCNSHSDDCDPETGECRFCRDNTEGPQCERCSRGYYGDATVAVHGCRKCPCPLTEAPNQFSPVCDLDRDGQPTCTACPEGYEGRNCERCADGYVGNPMVIGDYCRKTDVTNKCDARGSLQLDVDPRTQTCVCKSNVQGRNCDQCKPNTFYLSVSNPSGCIRCFCMGVTDTCTSTSWNRAQVGVTFTRDNQGFALTDYNQTPNRLVEDGFFVNTNIRELEYRQFTRIPQDIYYWQLPQRFLGDKVAAYGGNLRFVVSFRPGRDSAETSGSLVKISGNRIVLDHYIGLGPRPNTPQSYSIPFYENNWRRYDGQSASREDLLMVLADLDAILIKATFTRETEQASIRDVIMDVAEERNTGQARAFAVEQCVCPRGYRGLSCEDCDTGYTRSGDGPHLGRCVPCQCNRHSTDCDPETGKCRNCQHNTNGDNCEICSAGFYGDATRGSPSDCQPCPCPLTRTPNQFSPTCILDSDGQVTCTACPAGHTGRRCETCIQGYTGNPMIVGDYCRINTNPGCNCDARGSVPNTQCDPVTKQCQCKANVQGRRCTSCKDGYFYLGQENPQGCLACWCSGITDQCSSSNYYRDTLRPQFGSDGSHNFVLTTRRLSRTISDGLTVDSGQAGVTFRGFMDVQQERESLFFSLPPKFRGNRITSYGGYLKFTLDTSVAMDAGGTYRDVDIEFITKGQENRMYHLFEYNVNQPKRFEILLRESGFKLMDGSQPSRAAYLDILSNLEAIIIRATYHTLMGTASLRDVSMDTAVSTPTGLDRAPMVESCRCPEGYTGLSCEDCAPGYLRTRDASGYICTRCNCNGHATSCDRETGQCLNCQHNTVGDRCERCAEGFYGDATVGTESDCRPCPCPLTIPSNQFSRSCYLASDNQVTCDRCPVGYIGRNCEECDNSRGYYGNPRQIGEECRKDVNLTPVVVVNPITLDETVGGTVVYTCDVTVSGPVNVVWSRLDGQPLPPRAEISPRYRLTIRDIVQTDSGRYVCTATNTYGSRREIVTLNVIGRTLPIRVTVQEPREITVEQGRSVRFVCSVVGTREEQYILSWSRQNSAGLPDSAIDQNGVLIISNVQPTDQGTYVCSGSDSRSRDTAIAVLFVSTIPESPQITINPRYQRLDAGSTAEFLCTATGTPQPTVSWRSEQGSFRAGVTQDNGLLRIPSITKADEMNYFCTATNVAGTSEVRTILFVTGIQPDLPVSVGQSSIIAIVGTTIQLVCSVEARDVRPTLVWSRRGLSLPPGSSQDGGVLILSNIQLSSSGVYVCTATTDTGRRGSATTEVTVREEEIAPDANIESNRITIPMGTTGTIRCVVTGKPIPTVTWSKARGELTSRHQITGNTLRIVNAQMEDRGVYLCRAQSTAGTDQAWAVVEVERRTRPKISIYPEEQQTITVGGSALIQCRVVEGDPPPSLTWSRGGNLAFTSNTQVLENGVLRFNAVTGDEQGTYVCTATNDMGSISATASIAIQGPPRITIHPSTVITTVVGRRVSVECVGEGSPTPTVYWKYQSSTVPQRGDLPLSSDQIETQPRLGSATLTLESVQVTDQGNYQCVATSDAGISQENVQIIVQEPRPENPRVVIDGPDRLNVQEGERITLQCNTEGLINPYVQWRRREGQLPPNHQVTESGMLIIPRFMAEYSGEYICSAISQDQTYEASVFIIVTVRPILTISPARIEARAGESVQLRCTPQGAGPYQIEWSKTDSAMNPRAIQRPDGLLIIEQVTAADAGRYRCLATSNFGSTDGYADVIVEVRPTVSADYQEQRAVVGQTIQMSCSAQGYPRPEVTWQKVRGSLPPQHAIRDGVLTIYNFQVTDEGRYLCVAENKAGSARDYVDLLSYQNGGRNQTFTDTQTVSVGERVEMECVVTGFPQPTVRWSRLDAPLQPSARVNDVYLVIDEVSINDAGTYVCTAENVRGRTEQRVTLYVRSRPLITGQGDYVSAALGTSTTMHCNAEGYPEPQIRWYRKDGQMPRSYDVENGELRIEHVRPEDAGMYVCSAQNEIGTNEHAMELQVGDLVPHFNQDPVSYISYPPLNDVYLDFDILLSLRPETTDGLVLYNGQYDTGTNGDFVCFGVDEGYPEFRFDMGSGPAIIRGDRKLDLNEWHTVHLKRNRTLGEMKVNDQPLYVGNSQGTFQGLDLKTSMYLGGVPDYNSIPTSVGYRQGFVGAVSQVKLKGVDLNLGAEAVNMVGVSEYYACRSQPCQNGGHCRSANNKEGYACLCRQGFTGPNCTQTGERCYIGACGAEGRCINQEGTMGYKCICPFGRGGTMCATDIQISSPQFNQTSFVSYPPVKGSKIEMKLDLEFKPHTLEDGIILYSGQNEQGSGDFISLALKDEKVVYQYNTGSGTATLTSRNPIRAGQWTKVSLSKTGNEGSLKVNEEEEVKAYPWTYYRDQYRNYYNYYMRQRYRHKRQAMYPGTTVGLDLRTQLYLGGVEPLIRLPRDVRVTQGFTGCISMVTVNMQPLNIVTDALEMMDVTDCSDRNVCNRRPCLNGGACERLSLYNYRCTCPLGFTGRNCEARENICNSQNPCMNNAACSITADSYRCDCPIGYAGDHCDRSVSYADYVQFSGTGFLEYNNSLFLHTNSQEEEIVTIKLKTNSSNGLLFWHGDSSPTKPLMGDDYMSLGLQDGYIIYSFNLGNGPMTIRSDVPVNNGQVQTVQVTRLAKEGTLAINGGEKVTGESQGPLIILNPKGHNFYLGGVPSLEIMTGGKYVNNFMGCVLELNVQNRAISIITDANRGYNILPCY